MIIAINGNAASGKGTLATLVAQALRIPHYDFGLLYRGIAATEGGRGLVHSARAIESGRLVYDRGRVKYEGHDLTDGLRTEACGLQAAQLAAASESLMARVAKLFVQGESFVADGRTVSAIYPEAAWHFQLVTDLQTAFARRELQVEQMDSFHERWSLDASRKTSSPRAVEIDTSKQSVDESLAMILSHLD